MEEQTRYQKIVMIFTEPQADALRGTFNAIDDMCDSMEVLNSARVAKMASFLMAEWMINPAWKEITEQFYVAVHEAGWCKDPKCQYKKKLPPTKKGD